MHLPWMNRSDRKRWKAARTLPDLGQLAAAWWESAVRHLHGYRASHRPHPLLADHTAVLPAPPAPAPKFVCRECGCTYRDSCGDGCYGVQDQDDGRCGACIDPSVIIDWSKVRDGEESKCVLCDAPFFSAGRYCSTACQVADASDPDDATPHRAIGDGAAVTVWLTTRPGARR
ncbi:hypothetical protein [Streptomyces sp. NPDC102437]|uniref:hypothetical protein n=1 Tax=Streptomyces sp. NPDC102437 TaxID=3366175 RepID=UPI00382B1A89